MRGRPPVAARLISGTESCSLKMLIALGPMIIAQQLRLLQTRTVNLEPMGWKGGRSNVRMQQTVGLAYLTELAVFSLCPAAAYAPCEMDLNQARFRAASRAALPLAPFEYGTVRNSRFHDDRLPAG